LNDKNDIYIPSLGGKDFLSVLTLSCLGLFVLMIFFLLYSNVSYIISKGFTFADFMRIMSSPDTVSGMKLSAITSFCTLVLVVLTSVPVGYALSRFRFKGYAFFNMIIDVPLVLPPVVVGLSLLAFFGSNTLGEFIREILRRFDISLSSVLGIIMCQYLLSVSYCIRASKTAFDSVDRNLEFVAMTLGCSRWQVFRKVTMPLSLNGVISGSVMAWARAVGVFGPVMVFVGTSSRVQIMPTQIWVELSIGNIEKAFAISFVMVLMAGIALTIVHYLAPRK